MVYDVHFGLYMDLPKTVVHVADLLRFCYRHGNFFISVELGGFIRKNFLGKINSNNFVRAEFFLPRDTVRSGGLLLHVLALPVARVAHGTLSDELARKHRFYSVEHRDFRHADNFRGDIFSAPSRV